MSTQTSSDLEKAEVIERARTILRSRKSNKEPYDAARYDEIFKLAKSLKGGNHFGLARRLLLTLDTDKVPDAKKKGRIKQELSLCTYKDPDLPPDARLKSALDTLKSIEDLKTTTNQETLGQAGAIHKRMWEVDAQKQNLERSLHYYMRGYKAKRPSDPGFDNGYTGISAAFMLDLLAHQEEKEAKEAGAESETAKLRRQQAIKIREDLIAFMPALPETYEKDGEQRRLRDEWWYHTTIAEAYFGLGRYEEARPSLKAAAALKDRAPKWQQETTTRQLVALAQLRPEAEPETETPESDAARQVLREFLSLLGDESGAALESASAGKIGLALSGGGFRASLFHIGVLAKLAELGVLHRVEVISCVSGGSIIGAHYYLEVKQLLKDKTDSEIEPGDYVKIVERISKQFLEGVQRNIRTRVAAEFKTNLKMIGWPNYSRTKRAGELYESELFSRVPDDKGTEPRYMTDLYIEPKGAPKGFKPKYDNWRRVAKVPDLVLNAASLNTGHNWQFTASWMGEPPAGIDTEIDCNYRLRRVYHGDVPALYKDKQKIRLGDAVGASACVPALFEPIALPQLYGEVNGEAKEVIVRLVDGGVHDNQGIVSLLEQNCTQIIVSDASGQMDTMDDPSAGLLSVPTRSNSILMARVREAQYHELVARHRSSLLRGLVFIHLKKDLSQQPLDWLNCNDRFEASNSGDLTSYGVKKDIQALLAATRTDLDSFSEAEAFALMMSGYAMIEQAHNEGKMSTFPRAPVEKTPSWNFLSLREAMRGEEGYAKLKERLEVAHMKGFKIWKRNKGLKVLVAALGIGAVALVLTALAGLALLLLQRLAPQYSPTFWIALIVFFGVIVIAILLALLGLLVKLILRKLRKTPSEIGIGLAMIPLCLIARLHLWVFDSRFLKDGSLKNVTGKEPVPQEQE